MLNLLLVLRNAYFRFSIPVRARIYIMRDQTCIHTSHTTFVLSARSCCGFRPIQGSIQSHRQSPLRRCSVSHRQTQALWAQWALTIKVACPCRASLSCADLGCTATPIKPFFRPPPSHPSPHVLIMVRDYQLPRRAGELEIDVLPGLRRRRQPRMLGRIPEARCK